MRILWPFVQRPLEAPLDDIDEAGALEIRLILGCEVNAAIGYGGAFDAEGRGTVERVVSCHCAVVASVWEEEVLQLEVATRL